MLGSNHKGSVLDIFVIVVIVFSVSIGAILAQKVLTEVQDVNQNMSENTQMNPDILANAKTAVSVFDYGVIFLIGGMYLVAFIFAFNIRSHPIFFIPSLLLLSIATYISAEVANIFYMIANTSGLTTAANQFPTMITLFENLPFIVAGLGVLLIIVMYTQPSREVAQV